MNKGPRTIANVKRIRCAIYTRKSTEDGLEQEFNSLDAQRESAEAFVKSQSHEGWECLPTTYDDGGYTGGNMERPALKRLLTDIDEGKIDCVLVYKVDRLSRSLMDFARIIGEFDKHEISFVSVTQQFNTATSMGRLVLNVLLSFAQFEREMISERTRDKIAATRRKGKWCGGPPILGYDVVDTRLVVNPDEAQQVRALFDLYLASTGGLLPVVTELNKRQWCNKRSVTRNGKIRGGKPFDKNSLWYLLTNITYAGRIRYKEEHFPGEHQALISDDIWRRAQAKLQRNGRAGGSRKPSRFGGILKGLLICSSCQCAMVPNQSKQGNKRYLYYVCSNAQKRGWNVCPGPSIPAAEIERFVMEHIRSIGRNPQLVSETIQATQRQLTMSSQELASEELRLEREIAEFRHEINVVVGQTTPAKRSETMSTQLLDLHDRISRSENRLAKVRQERMEIKDRIIDESEIMESAVEFESLWNTLPYCDQSRVLKMLIQRIEHDGKEGSISISFLAEGTNSNQLETADSTT